MTKNRYIIYIYIYKRIRERVNLFMDREFGTKTLRNIFYVTEV